MTDLTEIFGEPISVYTVDDGINDGLLVPIFQNRWDQLAGGGTIVATATVHAEFSLAALREIWNDYIHWGRARGRKMDDFPFVTKMNGRTVWVSHDGGAPGVHTILFPEDD